MISVGNLEDICKKVGKEYGSDCSVIVQIKETSPSVNGMIGEYALSVGHNDAGTLFIKGFPEDSADDVKSIKPTSTPGKLDDFKNWKEVTKGLYRYVIAANVCYEIHIEYQDAGTDILTAKASVFIVGDWNGGGKSFFERECLLRSQPVFECIKKAIEDEKSNS